MNCGNLKSAPKFTATTSGKTSKANGAGLTSTSRTTFKVVPDNPVASFELTLPEGKYFALAANDNLCSLTKTVTVKKKVTIKTHGKKKTVTRNVKQTKPERLKMPTEFVAQNGATTAMTGRRETL